MKLSPAYHLRTNKTVERLLYLELLRKLEGSIPIGQYKYVSLGGPYLEDFSLVHGTFGNRDMVSLEIKEHVRSRQRINQPHSQVSLTLDSTTDFVEKYQSGRKPMIVWFDYEWPDWKKQISESCDLLQKLPPLSIFKITLAGKIDWLETDPNDPQSLKDPLAAKARVVTQMFEDYGPFGPDDIKQDLICDTLYTILRRAVGDAVPDTKSRAVRTLSSYRYNDGTPILTATMIIGSLSEIKKIEEKLKKWPYANLEWKSPQEISIPSLSLREKLAVDRLLPKCTATAIINKLDLHLAEKYRDSVKALKNYIEFYGHVPQFLRVSY